MAKSKDVKSLSTSVTLGPVETEIMELVWILGEASVRDIYQVLLSRRQIAYTTVMTILSNLVSKGVLKRRRRERAYVYEPIVSKDEFTRARIVEIVDNLLNRLTEPAITYLVERIAQVDPQRLDELEETIGRLRRQNKEISNG